MADDGSDQEKTEQATPRRLDKAREEGQVARSRELATFALLVGGVGGLWVMGATLYEQLGSIMEQAFLFERTHAFEPRLMVLAGFELLRRALFGMMPLFALLALIALIAPALLGGWLVSAKALVPQFSKLDPVKGLKRVFSTQALAELFKALAKSFLVGGVGVTFLALHIDEFRVLAQMPVARALARALELAAQACALMVLTLVVVVLIDVPYQLWSHGKKLRMTKDEVRREHKESDGDPQVKGRIRMVQQQMARRRMMSKVPEADVVVTNPTHFAVALRYDAARMAAPRVVAKGADAVAARIRALAVDHGVPLLEAPVLARALHRHVDLDAEVPAALYTAVAELLAWAFGLRRAQREGGVPPSPPLLVVPPELEVAAVRPAGGEG